MRKRPQERASLRHVYYEKRSRTGLSLTPDLVEEPRLGEGPISFCRPFADAHCGRGFLDLQAREVPELHQFRPLRRFHSEPIQSLVNRKQFVAILRRRNDLDFIHVQMFLAPAAPGCILSPGSLDKNTPHRFRGCAEKVRAILKMCLPVFIHEAQPRFMNQCGGLECMPWMFVSHFCRSEFPQFGVDEGEKFCGGINAAVLHRIKDDGYIVVHVG